MTATAIEVESWEISSIRCQAQRYCDQRDITDNNVFMNVCRMLAHRAFMEETEPLRALKVKICGILHTPVMHRMLDDGTFEVVSQTMGAEQTKALAQVDEWILSHAKKYGLTQPGSGENKNVVAQGVNSVL